MADPPVPSPAATVILLRRGGRHSDRGLQVLLVRRNPEARFMPGVWVFPGGMVEADELIDGVAHEEVDVDADERAHRAAAIRELGEEAGITLEAGADLRPWTRWVTPEPVSRRFDTRFYVALAPAHARPRPDGSEIVDWRWIEPAEALRLGEAGELDIVFPTVKHLESLLPFADAEAVLAGAAGRDLSPILPRVLPEGDSYRVVLPDDPDYPGSPTVAPSG